jgi:glycosyltransferase involved in cell wall biosynthesis
MDLLETTSQKIDDLKCCILIPTYNNHKTLQRVIDGVLLYTNQIIVVNDGSTDETNLILENYKNQICIVTISQNKGKGNALRTGFNKARELRYNYVITIDSDGQHFPSDIPTFIENLEKEVKPVLLIGSRNMNQDGIPKKSSFGNKFSNFWFWFETGIKLQDTQSGYRLYPLNHIPKKYFTNKFEFEIEVIVRSAWKGILVKNIPVDILYDPNERVSHFRPFKDFTRISILNTVLVFITLLYIKPRDFFKSFKKKSFKAFVKEDILESSDSIAVKSASIALGVFIGIAPFWGLQTFLVLFLAVLLKWNKALAFAFSNISIPPFIPFILYASLKVGSLFVSGNSLLFSENKLTFEAVRRNLAQYIIGSFVLATLTGFLFGLTSFILLTYLKKKKA